MPDTYRILVTGSRDWTDRAAIDQALNEAYTTRPAGSSMTVVHGACPTGADNLADEWATAAAATCDVTTERHPANWANHGRRAGFIRNADMVSLGADLCLAFIRNGSRGASHTARLAEKAGIRTGRWTTS